MSSAGPNGFIKQSLGWEEIQVLALEATRFLAAFAAAAAFLFECRVTPQ